MQSWAVWLPSLITLISVIYGAGAIVGRIKDQETTVAEHHAWLKAHDVKLSEHDVAIAVSAAFRQGYNAGKEDRPHGRTA